MSLERIIGILFFLAPWITAIGQFDYIVLPGQMDSIQCRMVEVRQDYVSFIRKGEMSVETKSTHEIKKIKLFQSSNEEGVFNTSDLIDIFNNGLMEKVIWMGLDMTYVKICRKKPEESFSSDLFRAMNEFIIDRSKKEFLVFFAHYNSLPLSGMSKINLTPINIANSAVKQDQLFDCVDDPFTPLDYIRKSVKRYVFESITSGIGMVFFYNSINKQKEKVDVTLVFFDIKSRDVILVLSDELPAGGIGAAWHWTKGLPEMIGNLKENGAQYGMLHYLYALSYQEIL